MTGFEINHGLCRALELGNMVEEVLSEEAEPRHLAQLQTAIDNLQSARSACILLVLLPNTQLSYEISGTVESEEILGQEAVVCMCGAG